MSNILMERYRTLYEHEKASNAKMLAMIESVPKANHDDARFRKALTLAAHLAACRENWFDRMTAGGQSVGPFWKEEVDPASLRPRYGGLEETWTRYLEALRDADLDETFEFTARDGKGYRFQKGMLIEQMVGHAAYHRGQIALLVDQLGGATVDTDYLYWKLGL